MQLVRAPVPGGQNVNKVATAAQLRFHLGNATYLPETLRKRLFYLARGRIAKEATLVIEAHRIRVKNVTGETRSNACWTSSAEPRSIQRRD